MLLRELDESLKLGGHAYFQRMYVCSYCRSDALKNRLFHSFIKAFVAASEFRDHRADFLLSESMNPRLRSPFVRKYFSRLAFRLLGTNIYSSEIWSLPLKTIYAF